MKKIIVTVPQFGKPVVEAEGFNGQGCEEATSMIEKALNSEGTESREYKPEWSNFEVGTEDEQEHIRW